jgi:hypothetical protein
MNDGYKLYGKEFFFETVLKTSLVASNKYSRKAYV